MAQLPLLVQFSGLARKVYGSFFEKLTCGKSGSSHLAHIFDACSTCSATAIFLAFFVVPLILSHFF
jgi:hypothetical protein